MSKLKPCPLCKTIPTKMYINRDSIEVVCECEHNLHVLNDDIMFTMAGVEWNKYCEARE